MTLLERIIAGLLPTIKAFGVESLVKALDRFHEKDTEKYSASIRSAYIGLQQLLPMVKETKSKFDDTGVEGIIEAIEESAEKHNVELPEE